jgi:tetratricopeptide (TPR) repeat protein
VSQAIEKWDAPTLALVRQWLAALAKNAPANAEFAYWHAVAAFHTVLMGDNADADLSDVINAARAALRLNPQRRDVHAMLCVLYGMRIKNSSLRAVWLGPRVMRHGKQALLPPEDPRALYLTATCRYHAGKSPADYSEALRLLTRAETLFAEEKPSPAEPRWGRAEAMLFTAYTLEKLGRAEEAKEVYRKLLALRPGHAIATERLK